MGQAIAFLVHQSNLSAADLAQIADLLLLGFAVAALLALARVVWRLMRSVVRSMAHLLSWVIAVAAIGFLLLRLARYFV